MIDSRIVKFIGQHHAMTLATTSSAGAYCSTAFYAFDSERVELIFTTDSATRHAREMVANRQVSAAIALETMVVGKIRGVQIVGTVRQGKAGDKRRYIMRFPFAVATKLEIWVLSPTYIKYTDNRLGFGKKLIWTKELE